LKEEASLERARRNVTEAEDRIGKQQLHIVRLRDRDANAMAAAQLLDAMKGARRLARERLDREEAASRLSLWLQGAPSPSIH
jgi:RNase H-fold protein (predicted Holliday junction resolvase)